MCDTPQGVSVERADRRATSPTQYLRRHVDACHGDRQGNQRVGSRHDARYRAAGSDGQLQ
ncbi:protein of unknown function (plasmid) [Cupriavidus taiwanensis]|uniref:Uncharacterized protein n=1 Tax=Cupriavidus taiwanensis TaxID=164546 RepID=A0A375IQ43_9BURK|nr:protein of unknown function [Cupriavidus taiwanensis]